MTYGAMTLSKGDQRFLNIAIKVAETSEAKMRHGAVVVRGGSVIGVGVNKRKNDPLIIEQGKHRSSCGDHAEVSALKRTSKTEGATIYIARVNRKAEPVNSKPCNNCQESLDKAGIRKVVFTL